MDSPLLLPDLTSSIRTSYFVRTEDYFIDGYQLWPESQIDSWECIKRNRAMKTGLILFIGTKKEMV